MTLTKNNDPNIISISEIIIIAAFVSYSTPED